MSETLETIFVEIDIPNRKNIIIGTIYRPPASNSSIFLTEFQNLLANPIFRNKHCFFLGDYNIDY